MTDKLTPKQEIFCQEYVKPPAGYYVYHLIDPISREAFYVGKGKGNRALQHEREVLRNESKYTKSEKGAKIAQILKQGRKTMYEFYPCADEQEALDIEQEHISNIGLENLTNINSKGCISGDRKGAKTIIKDIIKTWLSIPDVKFESRYPKSKIWNIGDANREIKEILECVKKQVGENVFYRDYDWAIGRFSGYFCTLNRSVSHAIKLEAS